MNHSLHLGIIRAMREMAFDRDYFVNTLEQIISDLQDQITIDDVRDPGASASRIGRRPETPVLDSWRLWNAGCTLPRDGCWWVNCSFQTTIDLIENIFVHGLSNGAAAGTNITWGTLLRYFKFIHSETQILEAQGLAEPAHAAGWRSIVDKFNNEEEESIPLMAERARELGYLMSITSSAGSEPTPEATPEPTPTQRNNESVRKLQDVIDSLSRGEKIEINEGEYLQLSDFLKRSFVSQ